MLQIGSVLDGKYKVLSKIGQGGMSVVYLALNERANKTWAIKEIRKDGVRDFAAVKQGLIAEINILKELNHKYLPSIVDVIDDRETFIIVMDYIQGKSLQTVLEEGQGTGGGNLSAAEVIAWGKQLCDVLHYLHTRPNPIIYRDMKPANVMLKPDGEISLIDFGTARVFKTGNAEDTTCLGTPGYAAPEQYGGNGQSGPQTDIYCLGATLHHLITGRNPAPTPFHFPRITQCRPSLLEETPREQRNLVLGLEMIIEKCTQYEAADRYQSCAELMYDLKHPEELGLPYRRKCRNKMIAFGGAAAMAVLFLGVSLFGRFMENRTITSGYDYYMDRAMSASVSEGIDIYHSAITLNPTKEEAYLGLLNKINEDGEFSSEENSLLIHILNSKDNGRAQDNRTYFQENASGYVEFAYNLGMDYFYTAGDASSKSSAVYWFNVVREADMDSLDLGDNNANKQSWQARAEVLYRICNYYRQIGVVNRAGDAEISYMQYWSDLVSLLDTNVFAQDNETTELYLYHEMVSQIHTRYMEFINAGVQRERMENALDQIASKTGQIIPAAASQAEVLKLHILDLVPRTQEIIDAAYTYQQGGNQQSAGEAGNASEQTTGGER